MAGLMRMLVLLAVPLAACAQNGKPAPDDARVPTPASTPAAPAPGKHGAGAFCLFELPAEGTRRRYVNLGIVQYVEVAPDELKIVFGGGNLGSGHEARIAVKSREEAAEWFARLNKAAADCH